MEQKDLIEILNRYSPDTKVLIYHKGYHGAGVYHASYMPIIRSKIEVIEEVRNLLDDSIFLRIWLE